MAFQGDLSNINLASVFQNLLQNEQTGTLRIYDGERDRYVYFRDGRISMFSTGADCRTPVGEFLVRRGDATAGQLATARKRRRSKKSISSVFAKMGIAEEKIREAARNYVEEEVCDLFTWDHGRFEFTEGEPIRGIFDADIAAANLGLNSDRVILEAARRADEWEHIGRQIRGTGEIFVLRKEREPQVQEHFDNTTVQVAAMMDGTRDVKSLIAESGVGRFFVSKAIAELLEGGYIRPVSLTEVMAQAENALQSHNWPTAIRCFRRALEMERNNIDCRRGLASALEGAGEKNEALAERKLLANTLADLGRKEEAAKELKQAIEDVPTDVTARERYVALLLESNAERAAEAARIELGRTYLSLGIAEKARDVFAAVLEAKPREPAAIAMMLADACMKAGDVQGAVQAYLRAGEQFLAGEEFEKASDVYAGILKIQPGNTEAKRRLDEITSGKLLRRKKRWRLIKYAAIAAAVVLVALAWLYYDFRARRVLHEQTLEALACVESGDLEKAIAACAKVRKWYPFTYASLQAKSTCAHLSERLALRLIAEGERIARSGRNRDTAAAKFRRAAEISPVPETRERARKALKGVGGGEPEPGAGK